MWMLHDIGYLLLFVALCVAFILPASEWWTRRWNAAQATLQKADPQAYERQRFRACARFENVDLAIVVIGAAAAFVALRRCMAWWGG